MNDRDPDRSVSQTVRAQLALRDMILSAQLRPGERISELQAVDITGVSRTPVRLALVRLEGEGLYRTRHSGFDRTARHAGRPRRPLCGRARRQRAQPRTIEGMPGRSRPA